MKIITLIVSTILASSCFASIKLTDMAGNSQTPEACRKVKIDSVHVGAKGNVAITVADPKTGKHLRPTCDRIIFSGESRAAGLSLQGAVGKNLFIYSHDYHYGNISSYVISEN